jgi:hypothetical protein
MHTQSLSFHWQGRRIRWTAEKALPNVLPFALDVVNGAPVVVMPIQGMRACHEFGYPHEGLAAWRHEGGKWARIGLKSLPPDLAVNLLQDYSYRPERGTVTVEWKQQFDSRGKRGRASTVVEAARTEGEASCKRLRPAPDPALDEATRQVRQAEQAAKAVVAERIAFTATPETASAAELRASMGTWQEVSWVAESCRGIVQAVEPRRSYEIGPTSMRSQLSGYLVKLGADARLAFQDSQLTIGNIACDDRTVVVIRRNAGDRVLVDRFDHAGRLIDATWVQLPNAGEVVSDPNSWAPVWRVEVAGSNLRITLADYAYTRTMTEGGTLRRKAVYEATLPTR